MPLLRDLGYLAGPSRLYRPAYGLLAAWIGQGSGALLDLGCGPGWLCVEASAGRPDLDCVGIDHSDTVLRAARRNGAGLLNCTFKRMSAEHIVYPDATFDVVTAVQSAHHWEHPAVVLDEALRVLKPGGRLLVLEANPEADLEEAWLDRPGGLPPAWWVRRMWRRWHIPLEPLAALAREAGCETELGELGFYRSLRCSR